MKHTKPQNGDIRQDGKRYDGTTWRKTGVNHHLNEEGLVYYKRKYRTIEGYLRQGGNINKLVFGKIKKPKAIAKVANLLYNKEKSGDVYIITNPSFDGWLKIGMAVDAEDRCNGYQTSSPHRDYRLLYSRRFNDRRKAETKVMRELKKIVKEHNGEWFKTDRETAQQIIEGLPVTI